MWPWEHVAVGYLCYSLLRRGRGGGPPGNAAAVAVAVAAMLPDLVDKTLSWGLGLVPQGYAVGHSLLVAVPVTIAVLAVAGRRGRGGAAPSDRLDPGAIGVAAVVGHWSHLAGDAVYPALLGGGPAVERLLWPVASLPAYETRLGLLDRTALYLSEFGGAALAGRLGPLLALELALLVGVLALWLADGAPGVRPVLRAAGVGSR